MRSHPGAPRLEASSTNSRSTPLGIYCKIVDNGGAVNGVDFSTPATGEVIIPAGQSTENLSVPLLDSGVFDTYVCGLLLHGIFSGTAGTEVTGDGLRIVSAAGISETGCPVST